MKPITDKGYKLLHHGSIALAEVEANGIRIDTDYLDKAIARITKKIKILEVDIKDDDVYKKWKKVYGKNINMGSRVQLGKILFTHLGYESTSTTVTGKPQVNETTLKAVGISFTKKYLKIEKLKNARSTYLEGIRREVVNGFIHPLFNLHLPQTYRSSSSNPNFQNIPIRDPKMGKLVRQAFIARQDHQLVEIDYKGLEVAVAACYHKDPRMIKYLENPKLDMHRDMAQQCYMIPEGQVTKEIRFWGKSGFIFPQFYGDYYVNCAKNMWNAIDIDGLTLEDGTGLKQHLSNNGITKLGKSSYDHSPKKGTFEYHIKEVEDDFWNNRFKIYNRWRKRWWQQYQEKGYFETLTGFRIDGAYKRNEVINYPVQGSAFHCLLWSLIRLNAKLKKYKMKSKIVGQIHDSIVGDVYKDEVQDYLSMAHEITTVELPKAWKWIIVPLEVDAEIAPLGGSWHQKEKIKIG